MRGERLPRFVGFDFSIAPESFGLPFVAVLRITTHPIFLSLLSTVLYGSQPLRASRVSATRGALFIHRSNCLTFGCVLRAITGP